MIFNDGNDIKKWIIENSNFFYLSPHNYFFLDLDIVLYKPTNVIEISFIFFDSFQEAQKKARSVKAQWGYLCIEKIRDNLEVHIFEEDYEEVLIIKGNKWQHMEYYHFFDDETVQKNLKLATVEFIRYLKDQKSE